MRPAPRAVSLSLALVGIGSFAGALLDRLSFPHVAQIFTTCASSRQFLVEFRIKRDSRQWTALREGEQSGGIPVSSMTIDVDGKRIGRIGYDESARYYVCEGNHRARISYSAAFVEGVTETRDMDFAVSRPSLIYLEQVSERDGGHALAYELSGYEPDDPKVRLYPEAAAR